MSIIVKIEESRFPNVSRAKFEDRKYEFKGGIIGQTVEIKQKGKRSKKAKLLNVIEKSEIEKGIPCPHFEKCGGCSMLNIDYKKQLEIKKNFVVSNISRIGGIKENEYNQRDCDRKFFCHSPLYCFICIYRFLINRGKNYYPESERHLLHEKSCESDAAGLTDKTSVGWLNPRYVLPVW